MSLPFSGLTKAITSTVDYAYPNTRVKAWKGMMLGEEDMRALSSAKHLEEFVGLLEQQPQYKKEISKISQMSIYSVENLLLMNSIGKTRLASDIAPKDTKCFFAALAAYYEVELIKLALNKFDEQPGKKIEFDSSIYSPILGSDVKQFIKTVAEAKGKEEAVNMLKETRYDFIAEMPAEEQKTPGYIASALDRYYYTNLWNSTSCLSGKDRLHAQQLVGREIEYANLILVLRGSIQGFKVEKFLVHIDYGLNKRIVALAGKDIQEIISSLSDTKYKALIEEGMKNYEKDKSLFRLEMDLKKKMLEEYRNVFKGSRPDIGVLLGFLKLKEYEVRNTRAIAVAIDNGASQKDIMELVVL